MLRGREAAGHELVFGEILIGEVGGGRKQFLDDYRRIPWLIRVPHNEVVSFVRMRRLSGRGIGWIDSARCRDCRARPTVDGGYAIGRDSGGSGDRLQAALARSKPNACANYIRCSPFAPEIWRTQEFISSSFYSRSHSLALLRIVAAHPKWNTLDLGRRPH